MMGKLIDTHYHLDYYKNHKELYDAINELKQYTLCVTNSPGVFVSCKKIYEETTYLKFAMGFHPQDSSLSTRDLSDFMTLINTTNYVGEIGMDFSSEQYIPKIKQIDFFERIVDVCSRQNKVMTIHLRKSENEAIEIIRKYSPKKCIIHWFLGTTSQLEELIDLDCYFSVNTNMVRSKGLKDKLLKLPPNRVLVESDGPFTRVNGKKYSPELLEASYTEIADFYESPKFIDQVYSNFKDLLLL